MCNIKLFSDSTCDLPLSEINRMDVGIVPLVVTFDTEIFRDGIDITSRDLFKMVKEKKIMPKTSAPSPLDFYNAFKPYTDEGFTIIYIGISSKLSTTIHDAQLAAEHIGNNSVYVIDSLNLSGAIGGLIKIAYNLIKKGMNAEYIVSEINKIVPNYKLFFTMEKLDYLYMGGRCSSTQALFGKMLDIKPIISMSVDGLDVWKKTRGKKKAINLIVEEAVKDKNRILNNEIHIAFAAGNKEEGKKLIQQLKEKTGITNFHEYELGCVISSHCGEGTIGFGYYLNN